jgi:hypothetical protein
MTPTRTALALVCAVTIAAACFLALSYVTLNGTADLQPLVGLAVFVGLSAISLVACAAPPSGAWAVIPIAAGAAIVWVGWSSISHTLSGPRFEGYALVMGALGILQGILTVAVTCARLSVPAAAHRS